MRPIEDMRRYGHAIWVGVALLGWAVGGCDLSRADVVSRSPDLGPVVANPDVISWAPEPRDTGPDAQPDRTTFGDAAEVASDASGRPADAMDGLRDGRADAPAVSTDASCTDEAGPCLPPGAVLAYDFENGIDGWISTGIIWETVPDSSSTSLNDVACPTAPGSTSAYYTAGEWQDQTVEARVRILSFGRSSSLNRAELYARYQDPGYWYAVGVRADGMFALRRNASTWGEPVRVAVAEGEWHTLKLKVSGPRERVAVEGFLDGVLLADAIDTDASLPAAVGTVGLGVYGETVAAFDDVTVWSP